MLMNNAPNCWWKTRKSWLMRCLRMRCYSRFMQQHLIPEWPHLENCRTESTCPTCLASQSPPRALECGQIHWNSQWAALTDKNTHSFNAICIYIHFACQSQNKILSKHFSIKHLGYGCVGWNTLEYTTKQKQSKTHRHKKTWDELFTRARVPRAVGQIWWTGRPRSLHRWA